MFVPIAVFFIPAFAAGRAGRSLRSGLQAAVWTVTAVMPLTYAALAARGAASSRDRRQDARRRTCGTRRREPDRCPDLLPRHLSRCRPHIRGGRRRPRRPSHNRQPPILGTGKWWAWSIRRRRAVGRHRFFRPGAVCGRRPVPRVSGLLRAVEWLLQSDEPAIRLLTRRDILSEPVGANASEIASSHGERAAVRPATQGDFARNPYRRYTDVHWRLISFAELGMPPSDHAGPRRLNGCWHGWSGGSGSRRSSSMAWSGLLTIRPRSEAARRRTVSSG